MKEGVCEHVYKCGCAFVFVFSSKYCADSGPLVVAIEGAFSIKCFTWSFSHHG